MEVLRISPGLCSSEVLEALLTYYKNKICTEVCTKSLQNGRHGGGAENAADKCVSSTKYALCLCVKSAFMGGLNMKDKL